MTQKLSERLKTTINKQPADCIALNGDVIANRQWVDSWIAEIEQLEQDIEKRRKQYMSYLKQSNQFREERDELQLHLSKTMEQCTSMARQLEEYKKALALACTAIMQNHIIQEGVYEVCDDESLEYWLEQARSETKA